MIAAEREIITPTSEERELPQAVTDFLEAAGSSGALQIELSPSEIHGISLLDCPNPLNVFNTRFQQEHRRLFSPKAGKNRIVTSYLSPTTGLDLSHGMAFVLTPNTVARNSRHGTFFGAMHPAQNGQSHEEEAIDVAVKPFMDRATPNNYSLAWKEFVLLHMVADRGIRTLRPLGLVLDDKNAYIMTQAEKIIPLDDMTWEPVRDKFDQLKSYREMCDFTQYEYPNLLNGQGVLTHEDEDLAYYLSVLADLGTTFADVHSRRIYPQDSQAKNFVMDAMTSKVFPIDWERVRLGYPGKEDKESEHSSATYGLVVLMMSFMVPRSENAEISRQGISGIGLYSPLIKHVLEDLRLYGPSFYNEIKAKGPQLQALDRPTNPDDLKYSPGCEQFYQHLTEIMFYMYDLTFLQHYRTAGKERGMDPNYLESLPDKIKDKMSKYLKELIPVYLEEYLE